MRLVLRLAVGAFAAIAAFSVSAQATRTWVSGVGDDANPCSRTAPCKTFAGAISKTAAGGEIDTLDAGAYGTLTITKSITIDGGGIFAGVLNSGTNGFLINAGVSDHVIIRNVSINGGSVGSVAINGVRIIQAASVTLENVLIETQEGTGVLFSPVNSGARLALRNVTIRQAYGGANGPGNGISINVPDATAAAKVHLENVSISDSIQAVDVGSNANVYIDRSNFFGNETAVNVRADATVHIDRSSIVGNTTGVKASFTTALVRLSDSTVTGNTTGLSYATTLPPPAPDTPGQIISYNNNRLRGNTTDGAPTSAVYTR
jgi:hypothetical protein